MIKYSYKAVFTRNYSALIPHCSLHNYCFIIVNDVIGDECCEIQLFLTNDAGTTLQNPINFSKLIMFLLLTSQMFALQQLRLICKVFILVLVLGYGVLLHIILVVNDVC